MGTIHFRAEDNVAVITVDTPQKLNTFTRAMRNEIGRLLEELNRNSEFIGAVLTGAGDAFCAGQDLRESSTWGDDIPWVEEFETFARSILKFKKPLVAAVNGVAAGGGFQMALLCDGRIGHPGTRMGQPEVRTGLASITGTWFMQRSIGDVRARELALSGRLMGADELLQNGLLSAVVPREEVFSAALARCHEFARSPADSIARTKTWIYESMSEEMERVFKDATRYHRMGFASGVSQAGAVKFLGQ